MSRCPCRSRRLLKRCCGPVLAGRPAESPEALMRSRYAAYALGRTDYIVATTDPGGPQWQGEPGGDTAPWEADIRRFCETTRFVGLRILEAPEPVGDEGTVSFRAELEQGGRDASFAERSRFTRADGRWRYHSGERLG